jgi:hypothetical protein
MKKHYFCLLVVWAGVNTDFIRASFVKSKEKSPKRISHAEACGEVSIDLIELNNLSNALIRDLSLLNDEIAQQGYAVVADGKDSVIGKASVAQLQSYDATLQGMSQRVQAMRQEVSSMRSQIHRGPILEGSAGNK